MAYVSATLRYLRHAAGVVRGCNAPNPPEAREALCVAGAKRCSAEMRASIAGAGYFRNAIRTVLARSETGGAVLGHLRCYLDRRQEVRFVGFARAHDVVRRAVVNRGS